MHIRSARLAYLFFLMDGGAALKTIIEPSGERALPNIDVGNESTVATLEEVLPAYWQSIALAQEHLAKWNTLELDAVIAPGGSHAAAAHNKFK